VKLWSEEEEALSEMPMVVKGRESQLYIGGGGRERDGLAFGWGQDRMLACVDSGYFVVYTCYHYLCISISFSYCSYLPTW
jgi:hypothetical protein